MRVIAGEARGRSLEALPGTDVTRPTLSQVKEAMFSIVQFDLPGARVLDLYAGSGQLGIEALSRGAARCVFLDENREAVNIIMRNCKACGVFDRSRVNIGEAARYLSACREQFDIVLLDPPFRNGTLEKILPAVDKCTAPGGIVLCESETGIVLPAEAGGLTLKKQYKYGRVLLWKYTKPMQPAPCRERTEGRSTMNVNELLDTIEDALEEGANVPSFRRQKIVDVEQIRDYLDEIRANLPGELRQAQQIVNDRAQIVETANAQAQAIVKKAEERARILVSEAEIVKAAQQRAGEITTAAQNEARTLRQTVTDYCDNMLKNTEETMVENAAQVKNVRANLRQNAKKNG